MRDGVAPDEGVDGVRIRGGGALVGGALVFTRDRTATVGLGGIQGMIGVQINTIVGVYAVPGFDLLFGGVRGVGVSAAALIAFTFKSVFTGPIARRSEHFHVGRDS